MHRVVLAHGVVPPRRDDQHAAVADGVRQEGEEVERRPVGPVQVLEHQHDRRGGAETLERRAHLLEQVQLRLAAVPVARSRRAASRAAGASSSCEPLEDRRAAQRPERLDDREVGQGGSDEVDAPTREHGRAAPARPLRQLAGQPCLADAGGAGDQRGRAAPGRRSVERLLEPRQLRRPADEPVAGGRRGHPDRLGVGRRRRRRGMIEGRILVEDAVLQLGQAGRRVDPQLVAERGSQLLEGRERLGVPSLAVQRQHQLAARTLAQRVARHERLQLPHDVAMAAERELRIDPVLDGDEPQLVEVRGRGRGERLRELTERGPAPERARRREALGRRDGVAVGQRLAALLAQPLEPQQVDGLRRDLEPVARRTRLQRPARQDLAELRDVDVHHLHRRGGHAVAPQRVDERIDRHGPVRLEQQAGEQRALALPAGGHGLAAVHDLQRAEEPVLRPVVRELHGRMPDVSLGERLHRLRIARPARHDTTVPGCRLAPPWGLSHDRGAGSRTGARRPRFRRPAVAWHGGQRFPRARPKMRSGGRRRPLNGRWPRTHRLESRGYAVSGIACERAAATADSDCCRRCPAVRMVHIGPMRAKVMSVETDLGCGRRAWTARARALLGLGLAERLGATVCAPLCAPAFDPALDPEWRVPNLRAVSALAGAQADRVQASWREAGSRCVLAETTRCCSGACWPCDATGRRDCCWSTVTRTSGIPRDGSASFGQRPVLRDRTRTRRARRSRGTSATGRRRRRAWSTATGIAPTSSPSTATTCTTHRCSSAISAEVRAAGPTRRRPSCRRVATAPRARARVAAPGCRLPRRRSHASRGLAGSRGFSPAEVRELLRAPLAERRWRAWTSPIYNPALDSDDLAAGQVLAERLSSCSSRDRTSRSVPAPPRHPMPRN